MVARPGKQTLKLNGRIGRVANRCTSAFWFELAGRTATLPAMSRSAQFRNGEEIDWLDWTSQSRAATMRIYSIDGFSLGRKFTMGDKGGKKDKDKSKKQKANKQAQAAKAKQDKNRPK